MSGNSINFDDRKIKKGDFYNNKNKKNFNIGDIDVNRILVSKKEQYSKYNSFKYFIGYNDNDVVILTGYINEFDEDKNKNKNKNKNTITMSLKVNDEQLFKNDNRTWKKN